MSEWNRMEMLTFISAQSHNLLEHIKTCMIASRIATGVFA